MASEKKVHCIVLDASPLLLNQPSISSLLATAEEIYTVPAVIAEIRDPVARNRLETTVLPFLRVKSPSAASVKAASDFARKTGDYAVLSGPDMQIMALAYELECERNHGDWRLRKSPGQKELNGSPPDTLKSTSEAGSQPAPAVHQDTGESEANEGVSGPLQPLPSESAGKEAFESNPAPADAPDAITSVPSLATLDLNDDRSAQEENTSTGVTNDESTEEAQESESESDGEGWITPSNLKRHQKKDEDTEVRPSKAPAKLQVATLTSDYALQNTLLLMNLNLLSSTLSRISHLKSHILRCHACFATTKQMDRQFCDRCGKPTLTRVTCTTNANGEFKLHLKKNMQWNHRGDRYSIPKPTGGTSSGKVGKGGRGKGGKGGWGKELVFTEDQKEYTRAVASQKRAQTKDLMDDDYMPDILSGARSSTSKIKIGAGRDVNSRKR